ncbi:hypothetical protein GCM10009722_14150 [Williamsia deligens]
MLENSQNMTEQILRSFAAFASAGNSIPVQGQQLLVIHLADPINLIAEADPPMAGTVLKSQLEDVIEAAAGLRTGRTFDADIKTLLDAVRVVVPVLQATVVDEVEVVEDLIAELERTFMISLFMSMSAHFPSTQRVEGWEQQHKRFLEGGRSRDIGHYFSFRANVPAETSPMQAALIPEERRFYANTPGPGRVHMQHFISAINSGTNLAIAGGGFGETEYYPEMQSIEYAQWFTYMHAIWDEQFRPRLAEFFNRSLPEPDALGKNDITSDFFGDIRLIRNDFVHHYGEADSATKLRVIPWKFNKGDPIQVRYEQMIDLVDLFPREKLAVQPTRQPKKRTPLLGSVDIDLVARLKAALEADKTLDRNEVNDQLVRDWLDPR